MTETVPFGFTLHGQDGTARTGEIATPRGNIRTPAFMPVGTAATVKAMYPGQVRELGADVVLGNTYHLMLRPGPERMARLGGLHTFMNWERPILTDSGGFQVMSLSALRKIDEQGVTFRSHIDGTAHHMSPERSIEIQGLLGSDIQMQLDECVRLPAPESAIEVCGATCDSVDILSRPFWLPETVDTGDWIEIGHIGAYSLSLRTRFNGFYPDTFVEVTTPFDEGDAPQGFASLETMAD